MLPRTWLILLLAADGATAWAVAPAEIHFNRDVRPILSENCFACHGPDKNKRESELRLDTEEGAKARLDDHFAIVPGKPDESELYKRISSQDADERMPPADSGKTLTAAQIDLLRRWIAAGAAWEGHWSLRPIERPAPPPPAAGAPIRNPIDQFVQAGLPAEGLSPAPEADRITLLRRLSFDLRGLPPTVAEVESFLADRRGDAYERWVDQLLAAPQYGERMAMFWLDLVRYADSVGYHGDQPVSVSPFRDYVIRAFNENRRFDQFTREQLAGDLLAHPTVEQRIAAGYNRLGMMSAEGGVQDKEYRLKYAAERVRNLSGTWLGITLGCTECHDHKYDPFTTKGFYQLAAFFADIDEQGFYGGSEGTGKWGRTFAVPTAEQAARLAQLDREIAVLKADLSRPSAALAAGQAKWEAQVASTAPWTPLAPLTLHSSAGAELKSLDDHSILAGGPSPPQDTYTLTARPALAGVTALRIEVLPDESLPQKGPGRAGNGNFVLTELEATIARAGSPPQKIVFQNASATIEQKTYAEKNPYRAWTAAAAIDGDAKGAEWGWSILDEAGQANHAVFETKDPLDLSGDTTLTVTLKQEHSNPQHTLGRFRLAVTAAARPVQAVGAGLPRNVRQALAVDAARRSQEARDDLAAYYRGIAPELQPQREQLAQLERDRGAASAQVVTMLETAAVQPRPVRVLARGNWMDESGEVVEPAFPAVLPQPPAQGARLTRLDLAEWLVAPRNPLTARVLVNRLWKLYFGAGLSRKLDDLGAQGDWPSHPELLDWLAGQLIDSGWDVKRTIRLIVTSHTYRQSSITTAALREKDPYNRRLARQGRFRLEAEMVRDNALAISGLLVDKLGGPSVKPYQPPGYWAHLNFPQREWQNGEGDQLYRRGLYTHWQRQYLHPSLLAFDASSREECTAERVRSNTPLQSLVLLNDPTYVEAARVFAERALREGGAAASERLAWAFRQAVSRPIRSPEQQVLAALLEKHRAHYRQDPAAARQLIATGRRQAASQIDAAELAAWTNVCRAILNLHETVTRN